MHTQLAAIALCIATHLVNCVITVQCRIPGFDYVAAGNSTNKKDAQSNAAKDMVQYLVRAGRLSASEVPEFVVVCVDIIWFSYQLDAGGYMLSHRHTTNKCWPTIVGQHLCHT